MTSATHQIADPARWLSGVSDQGHGTAKVRALPALERATELLLAGLRLAQGIDRARFASQVGFDLKDALDPQGLDMLIEQNLVTFDDRTLKVTDAGRLTLNAILERLLVD